MTERGLSHKRLIDKVMKLSRQTLEDMNYAFKLRSSYGLPKERIQEIFEETKREWNKDAWECMLEQEKRKSRASSTFKNEIF